MSYPIETEPEPDASRAVVEPSSHEPRLFGGGFGTLWIREGTDLRVIGNTLNRYLQVLQPTTLSWVPWLGVPDLSVRSLGSWRIGVPLDTHQYDFLPTPQTFLRGHQHALRPLRRQPPRVNGVDDHVGGDLVVSALWSSPTCPASDQLTSETRAIRTHPVNRAPASSAPCITWSSRCSAMTYSPRPSRRSERGQVGLFRQAKSPRTNSSTTNKKRTGTATPQRSAKNARDTWTRMSLGGDWEIRSRRMKCGPEAWSS